MPPYRQIIPHKRRLETICSTVVLANRSARTIKCSRLTIGSKILFLSAIFYSAENISIIADDVRRSWWPGGGVGTRGSCTTLYLWFNSRARPPVPANLRRQPVTVQPPDHGCGFFYATGIENTLFFPKLDLNAFRSQIFGQPTQTER